jgi:tRNA (cmo5U34)-methyltransferase
MGNTNKPDPTREDTLFATPLEEIQQFAFNKAVVDVFPDMIKRSVPGYTTIIGMIGDFARRYSQDGTLCYDLGCSLGAATLSIRQNITAENCNIIAVDSSQAMINQAEKIIQRDNSAPSVSLICDDINAIEINNASLVVLNFTIDGHNKFLNKLRMVYAKNALAIYPIGKNFCIVYQKLKANQLN